MQGVDDARLPFHPPFSLFLKKGSLRFRHRGWGPERYPPPSHQSADSLELVRADAEMLAESVSETARLAEKASGGLLWERGEEGGVGVCVSETARLAEKVGVWCIGGCSRA